MVVIIILKRFICGLISVFNIPVLCPNNLKYNFIAPVPVHCFSITYINSEEELSVQLLTFSSRMFRLIMLI